MTFDGLQCFCAIVESGSFREAAQRVHRSQPAVSQQLRKLERELGQRLIDRRAGRPTLAGERLYDRARQVLLEVERLGREMEELAESEPGELRVGTSDTTAMYVLPPHVRRFAESFPRTRLSLTNRSSDAVAGQVLRGELDLGLVTLPQPHAELATAPLFHQRLVLALPEGHRLA